MISATNINLNYTSNTTWTAPTGVTSIYVEAWGGGGHGGTRSTTGAGGGGGGGAFAAGNITVVPGNTYDIKIGYGAPSATSSLPGGATYFDTGGDVKAAGGLSVATNNANGVLGGQQSNSTGTVKYSGGNGATGTAGSFGGGGGGGAGTTGQGGNTTASASGGTGATIDGGDGGAGRSGTQGNGVAGNNYGGGGGGGLRTSSGTRTGGAGAGGKLSLTYEEYILPPSNITLCQVGNCYINNYSFTWNNTGNNSLNFDGNDDYGELNDTWNNLVGSTSITISWWSYEDSGAGTTGYYFGDTGATNLFLRRNDATSTQGNIMGGSTYGGFALTFGAWSHQCVEYSNSGNDHWFYNGVLQNDLNIGDTDFSIAEKIFFGNRNDLLRDWQGNMDDIRIWNVSGVCSNSTALAKLLNNDTGVYQDNIKVWLPFENSTQTYNVTAGGSNSGCGWEACTIDCSTNHTISSSVDYGGYNVLYSGSGYVLVTATQYNMGNVTVYGSCNVTSSSGGNVTT